MAPASRCEESRPLSHGYRIAELQRLRAEEEARGRRLRREIATLTSPALIDRFAREQLHMVLPGPDDQIVLIASSCRPSRRRRPSSRHARRSHGRSTRNLAAGGRRSDLACRSSACCSACGRVAVFVRLVDLQIVQHDALEARGKSQQTRRIKEPAQRGDIVDRHGKPLAYTVEEDTLGVDPRELENPRAGGRAPLRCARRLHG